MLLRFLIVLSVLFGPASAFAEQSSMQDDARAIERASFDQFLAEMPDRPRGVGDYFADDPHANVLRIVDCQLRTELLLNPAGQTPLVIGWGGVPIDTSLQLEVSFEPWPSLVSGNGPDLARLNIIHPGGTVSLYSLASGWSGGSMFSGGAVQPLAPLDQLPLNQTETNRIAFPFLQDRATSSQRALHVAGLLLQYRDRYCTNLS